jgi:uncharacterized protein (DUF2461 family)
VSFQGFTDKTLEYFLNISLDNTKSNFEANGTLFETHVKAPLRALHESLVPTMLDIDPAMCIRQARCVSGAYNDARFARADPVKTYMYLHFRPETGRETDIPGFFMDASYDGYRYGLQINNSSAQGMTRLRDAVLNDDRRFSELAVELGRRAEFALEGDLFKKDHYPDAPPVLKDWLNRKSWWLGRTCPPDEAFFSETLSERLTKGFATLRSLYSFIVEALKS